jgi:hypothetical protein
VTFANTGAGELRSLRLSELERHLVIAGFVVALELLKLLVRRTVDLEGIPQFRSELLRLASAHPAALVVVLRLWISPSVVPICTLFRRFPKTP